MPKITVDGKTIEAKDRQMILQACLDADVPIPYYCYHQGLSIVASCRICLVEVEGVPKLLPACQTPVREGMVVHSQSTKAIANQKQVMEYLLVSHPLDCPVCDKAGECGLQDFSYQYGRSVSRFEEDKAKRPKKDVGLNILLYNDRCIMCTRCVRFTREISGTSELYVDGRGFREEIDIFPGKPLNNKLSGNVVDLCPVGALLDKDFLFEQRVWLLKRTASISPVDSGGENIWIDQNENVIFRIKPRYNPDVNQWWISDDTRYSYKPVHDPARLRKPRRVQYATQIETTFTNATEAAGDGLKSIVKEKGPGSTFCFFSPMMACEEVWLLGQYMRSIDPKCVFALGPVPSTGADEVFKHYISGAETFRIKAEKVPNAAGVQRVLTRLGGMQVTWSEFMAAGLPELKKLAGGWIVGGYLSSWVPKDVPILFKKGFKVVQDILASPLSDAADVVLPAASWAEKDGCWENHAGRIQAFAAAIAPIEGARREGDVYYQLLGREGVYNAERIRQEMGEPFAQIVLPREDVESPSFEFAEL